METVEGRAGPVSTQPFKDPAGIAGGFIARQAYAHALSLLFGFAKDPAAEEVPEIYIASAGFIEFQDATCAVTCYHVLKNFWAKRAAEPRFKFQIGSFVCEPRDRLRDWDEALDLAIIDVGDIPIDRLSNRDDNPAQALRPSRWPSDPMKPNDFVVLCGFPIGTREVYVDERRIGSVAFPVIEHVMDVDESSFTISFSRDEWVSIPSDTTVPDAIRAADLNGLSGSPVFSGMRNIAGPIGVMEFVGTVLSEIPFGVSGVRVRSSRCLTADGHIVREGATSNY
jgi:Trypsin-like peptidase domain